MATVAVENVFVFQWLRADGEIPLGSTNPAKDDAVTASVSCPARTKHSALTLD
jgi:hypothetical protein